MRGNIVLKQWLKVNFFGKIITLEIEKKLHKITEHYHYSNCFKSDFLIWDIIRLKTVLSTNKDINQLNFLYKLKNVRVTENRISYRNYSSENWFSLSFWKWIGSFCFEISVPKFRSSYCKNKCNFSNNCLRISKDKIIYCFIKFL